MVLDALKSHARFLYVVVVVWFAAPLTYAQTREMNIENSRAKTALIIEDLRPKLFDDLPPAERQIYDQIVFSVSSESGINAYARHRDGVRRVILMEGIGRATELNTDAFLIDQMYHKPGFLGNYLNYVCTQYQSNDTRHSQGLPPQRITSPYEYANWSETDLERFYADPTISRARNQALGNAFAFLLAHEVAHQIKGHVDQRGTTPLEERDQETEADAWAIDLLIRKHLNPVDGIIPLLFSYYTGRHPVSQESESDHPADETRLLKMYEGLAGRLPSFRPYLPGTEYEATRKRIDYSISLIKQEIGAEKNAPSVSLNRQRSSDSNSFESEFQSATCNDLEGYIDAAKTNFASLRGRADPDSEGESFYAKRGIAGFTDCAVWIYHDQRLEPTATCDATGGTLESLRDITRGCLGKSWSSREQEGGFLFEGPGALTVRLDVNRKGTLEIWVVSPSRD